MFEESSKQGKSEKDKKADVPVTKISLPKLDPDAPIPSDEEALKLIEQMKKIHDDINEKLETIFRKAGWTMKDLQSYLENPANFSSEEWKEIQAKRLIMLEPLAQALGAKSEDLQKQQKEINAKKTSLERKGKSLGSRRNWLSMK